jgi:hypothetical protein
MQALRVVLVVLGIYALVHVTVQSFRHVFVLLVEPRSSVLDPYDPDRQNLAAAKTLAELVAQYDVAHKSVQKWEAGKTPQELQPANRWEEPYKSRDTARQAIEVWEGHQTQIRQLHFFWWAGLLCLIAGVGCYRRWHPWLGAAFFIVAFGEMIYWTSPAFRGWSDGDEFHRLVLWKLLYSTATLALLLAMWTRIGIPLLRDEAATVSKAVG